jgi:hypothetical protein
MRIFHEAWILQYLNNTALLAVEKVIATTFLSEAMYGCFDMLLRNASVSTVFNFPSRMTLGLDYRKP